MEALSHGLTMRDNMGAEWKDWGQCSRVMFIYTLDYVKPDDQVTVCFAWPRPQAPFPVLSMLHTEKREGWEVKSRERYCTIALYSKV